jgi:hypothetical protein
MRKHISKKWLKSLNPCSNGYEYWLKQNKPYLPDFLRQCLKDDHFNWANWLIVRCLDKKGKQRYGVFAAEQVLHIFEKQWSNDDRPRKAIEAAKIVIKRDTKKNRIAAAAAYTAAAAASASAADAASASAADAADAAAYAAAYTADADAYTADYAASAAAYAAAYTADAADAVLKLKIIEYGISLINGSSCRNL